MVPELIVFDCDGVLVDSEALAIEVEAELLSDAGFAITPTEVAERFVGLSYRSMMDALAADFGRPVPEDLNQAMQRATLDLFPTRLRPVPGIGELLAGLTGARCVASSSDVDRITLSLDLCGLRSYFADEHVFSAQMVSRGKPAPDLFELAARRMAVEPAACLVIEDSPHGVEAARAAGMAVVGLTAGGHATPSLDERLRAAGAETVFTSTAELGRHLLAVR